MKRIFIILTALLSIISMSSFANPTDVTPTVLSAFASSFKNASEVSWTAGNNFYKASFQMNGQYISAFYNTDGELLAMSRNISSTQLPIALQTNLKQRYQDFWIADLFEVASENGTSYYITLENADTRLVLKSTNNDWSTFQKQRKS